MDLSKLDRAQLEAILLDPPGRDAGPLRCSEQDVFDRLPAVRSERSPQPEQRPIRAASDSRGTNSN